MPTFTGSLSHYGACTAEVWGLTLLVATRGRVGSLWIANKLPESRNVAFTVGNSYVQELWSELGFQDCSETHEILTGEKQNSGTSSQPSNTHYPTTSLTS